MCEPKEWTLMFYFASDNPLAISAVTQLKAIKDAGYHPDANVVAQFDPFTEGTPTHVFDVNLINRLKSPRVASVGFAGNDPTVRNMIEDKLWRDERTSRPDPTALGESLDGELVREALHRVFSANHDIEYKPPVAPNTNGVYSRNTDALVEQGPQDSLREFLKFCADKYPAKHYMLFMLGHGVVVGNDVFMLDEHASEQSLTLTQLGKILAEFKHNITLEGSAFELVGLHSCSVSSIEVAYELAGTAKYMLASQGPAFVGSWPYRQILVRIFNELNAYRENIDVRDLLFKIYNACLINSADYLLAGYSFQITLCDLERIKSLHTAIEELAEALTIGVCQDLLSRDFILLSHWKSQSFFNEMYTDLYDFCFCFSTKVQDHVGAGGIASVEMTAIDKACGKVMDLLVKENPKPEGQQPKPQIIVAADSLGPAYQYSRGLSIYFPWSEPSRDSGIMTQYEKYKFTVEFKKTDETKENFWLKFLRKYFEKTMRAVSSIEIDPRRVPSTQSNQVLAVDESYLDQDIASLIYTGEGPTDSRVTLALSKGDPTDKTGGDVESVSIKNYPRDIRSRRTRMRQADARVRFPVTQAFGLIQRNGQNGNH